ncbi:CrcB family protein [Caldibacillus lycopersici]|uniref:Fluoride-specific ion channel FluC n=1 Tax=Perspicuibacillus lycopersici TaxID=1325689 RepID=A0AAE3IWZ6_9BACI|nr:CrcB family protein [Perspicuibacillus lycopersici]MCU9613590.1 CrcB family protein [Perspicuibacillus lycopersici]
MWIFIGLGGVIGSLIRYGVSVLAGQWTYGGYPMATFSVNVVGSFLLALFANSFSMKFQKTKYYAGITTGIIGSFTTFSTFSLETVQLIENNHLFIATIYILLSFIFGIGFAYLGRKTGKRLFQANRSLERK